MTRLDESIQLRPYQLDAIDRLRERLRAGKRRIVLIAPTGAGKTVMASAIIRSAVERGKRVAFIAHRRELIDQAVGKLRTWGVWASVVMASDPRHDPLAPVQVCSVQTLARRMSTLPPADLLVIDECHHSTAATYRALVQHYQGATVLGLTATPWTLGRASLADIYESSVVAATPAELIRGGSLVPYEAHAYVTPDLDDVRTVAGDYEQRGLEVACDAPTVIGDIVQQYITHASGRRAILFPSSVAHSHHLIEELTAAGVRAEHLDCETPPDDRARILAGLASGEVQLVSSVGVLSEGFDCPVAEVCILARPTKSVALYLQQVGRVLRPSPGKARALIHDHAGNIMLHGMPDDARDYSLAAKPVPERPPVKCPFCGGLSRALEDGHCPACGQLVTTPAEPQPHTGKRRMLTVDGERISLDEVQRLRLRRESLGLRELTVAELVRAHRATREQRAAEYRRLIEVAERRGFKPGFVAHAYREAFSVWPRFSDEELAGVLPATRPFIPLPKRT